MKAPTAHREAEARLNPDRIPWDQRPARPQADTPERVYRLPADRAPAPLGAQLRAVPVPPLTGVLLAGKRPGRQVLQVKVLKQPGKGPDSALMAFEQVKTLDAALTRSLLVEQWTVGFVMDKACHDGEVWAFNPDPFETVLVSIVEA